MNYLLEQLAPKTVWHFFEEICAIPHGSRNCKAISDYLMRFARERGLEARQDEAYNVVIFGPGTPGYEDHKPVILQGHMDMVCVKEPDYDLDFEKDGLCLKYDDQAVFAEGTTLGGDDGIAAAYALAILDSKTIAHPPLEVIITTDEEIGLLGADALDCSDLKGRTMINLDSEEEGILTVSCAGGATAILSLPVSRKPVYGPCWHLAVSGLQGGHSGQEIGCGRANADIVLGQLLARANKENPLRLTKIQGGAKDNAIPRSCTATVVSMTMDEETLPRLAEELQEEIRSNYKEPEAIVAAEIVEAMGGMAMGGEDTEKVISLLCAVPNGVQAMSKEISGLVQTSLNLGVLDMEGETVKLTFSVRSSVGGEKEALLDTLRREVEERGGSFLVEGAYPAWEYRKDSPLRDLMCQVYKELFEKEPEIQAIHAGLECGLFSGKMAGLDCVSIGPDMQDIHTSRERLSIASVERTWRYLLEILLRL